VDPEKENARLRAELRHAEEERGIRHRCDIATAGTTRWPIVLQQLEADADPPNPQ
jgi:hypothetical protein